MTALTPYTLLVQMGSAKYGGFVLGTGALSCMLELAATAALHVSLPSGPYGLIFANFVTFALTVPPLQRFTLFGRQLTDKVRMRTLDPKLSLDASSLIRSVCKILGLKCSWKLCQLGKGERSRLKRARQRARGVVFSSKCGLTWFGDSSRSSPDFTGC